MTKERHVAGIPATERVVVGLCHDLNDQLAAISAYAFLMKRRGQSGELGDPLQEQIDRLAHSVRLVRSLCRSPEPEVGPVALSLLAEGATDLMHAYPDGPVRFTTLQDEGASDGSGVIRCDWTRGLRALLSAAAWVRRGIAVEESVDVRIEKGPFPDTVEITLETPAPPPPDGELPSTLDEDMTLVSSGPRSVVVHLAQTRSVASV